MTANAHSTGTCMHPLGRRATALTVALVVLSLAACGQSSSRTGQSGTTSQGTAVAGGQAASGASSDYVQAMLEWTRCMRENGVPDFPDPDAQGRFLIDRKKIDANSAAFKNAQAACQSKFPNDLQTRSAQSDAELLKQALEYAKCMRANGVPNFPDPEVVDGRLIMKMPAGVDPNSDAFRKAQAACKGKLPVGFGG